MFPAVGQNLKLGRGSLLLAPHDGTSSETGLILVGNMPSLELSWEIEERIKKSSTQRSSPIIGQGIITQDLTLVAQIDEHHKEVLKRFFYATEAQANQALSTTGSLALTDIITGRAYEINGDRSLTNVVITKGSITLVADTDYTLYAANGYVIFLDSANLSDGDDVSIAYDRPAVTLNHFRVGQVSEQFARLIYQADDSNTSGVAAGDRFKFWKVQITPDGAYQLVSDDYTSFNLRFKVLADSSHPNDPLGRIERVGEV